MKASSFSCTIAGVCPTHLPPLTLQIILDGVIVYATRSTETHNFEFEMPDDEGEHELVFRLSGKSFEHTKVVDGQIVSDAYYTVSNMAFDGIELGQLLIDRATYTHHFNNPAVGTIVDQFYGTMGCNGRVSLPFTTPLYQWLLEHM
jgi:hypothetical protein